MSTLSQFYPTAGGPWARNPRQMQAFSNTGAYLGVSTNDLNSNDSAWTTEMNGCGAYASIAAADTFVTVCDLTGSGLVTAIIAPYVTANTGTATFEVTLDGVVYTWTKQSVYNGHVGVGLVTQVTGNVNTGPQSTAATYNSVYSMSGISAGQLTGNKQIILSHEARSFGLPALRFETGLKVRLKSSTYSGSNPNDRCGVVYLMDT